MILTDVLEYVGKRVRVTFEDETEVEGVLSYVPAYSEMYKWKKAKHFYIAGIDFRAHHVKEIIEV